MSSAAGSSSSDEGTSTDQPRLKVSKIAAKAIAQREQQQQQGHKSNKQRSCQQQRQQQNASQDSEEEDQEDEAAGVEDQNRQDALGQLQQRLLRLQQQVQQQQQKQQKQQQRSNQQQRQRHQSLPQECEAQDQEGEEPDEGDQDALGQLLQQLQELHQELQQQLQQQGQQQNMGAEGASDGRNYSQIRGRLVAAVGKYAAQLLPRGDIILLVVLPLRKDGHLRTFHQGLTQDQLSAILDVLQNHATGSLGWMEARVQALLDMLGAGACTGGNTQGTGQQQGKQQKRQLSQQQFFQVPYPKKTKTDEEEGGWDEEQDDSEAVSEGEAAGAAHRRGRKHSGGRNTRSSRGSELRAAAAEGGVDGQPERQRQRAGAGKAASAAAAAAFDAGAARSPPKHRRLRRTDGWRQPQAAEAAEHGVALDDCDAAAATAAAPAAAAAAPKLQTTEATTVPELIEALWAGVVEAEAVQPGDDCTLVGICSAAFNAYEGAAAAGTLGKLQLRRVLREAYAWPLTSGTRERGWCDAAQEMLSPHYERREGDKQGSMQGDKQLQEQPQPHGQAQRQQQQQQEQVRTGARSQGGTVKVAAAGVHCANPAAAAALGPDAPTVAAAVAAAAPAAEEELHSNTALIQQHVRALLAGEVAVQAVLPGSRCTVHRICNAAAAAYRAAEAEGTLDGLRLRSALRTATGWLLQRNTEQRAWGDAAAAAVATYYYSCKQQQQQQQQQQRQEQVCAEGPGQRSGALAAAAPGAAEKQSVHPAAATAGKAEADQQRRPSGKQQQQQGQQQQLPSLVRAATAQRAHMPRKAAAGVSRATQAVLGNSQDLAAAAADRKAVAAAQRAALPASVSPPVTEAQRNMVQELDTGALGIDIDGIVAALSGVPARIQAGDGSADVEADIAYAEKLAGTLEKPSTRSTVQAAIAKARTAVNATKF